MDEPTTEAGAGLRPPHEVHVEDTPGALPALIASWLLAAQGGIGLAFLPILVFTSELDIPPGDIVTYAALALTCLVAAAVFHTHWRGAWWFGLASTIAAGTWIVVDEGLTSWAEAYVGAGFTAATVLFLLLGRRGAGHPEAMAFASARIPFRVKLAIVWVSIFAGVVILLGLVELDIVWILDNWTYIGAGLIFTLSLALASIVVGTLLALLGALGRLSSNPVAYGISGFYTSFFRGTPLIVQLFLIYAALPQIGTSLGRLSLVNILALTIFQVGVLGLGLNYGAYMTEIFRAGIQAVGHGQAEAADALGMTYPQRMRRVVLPQAIRVIIPPTGNEFIALLKDTALVGVMGGVALTEAEIFKRAQLAGNQDLRRLESYLIAAALYWALTATFTVFQARLERRMSKGYVRAEARTALGRKRPQFLPGTGSDGETGLPGLPEPIPGGHG